MRILGITGGIGAGKTTAAKLLRHWRVPIHCSDHAVHRALRENQVVIEKVKAQWPSVVIKGEINRRALGEIVFNDHKALGQLEKILFPEVYKSQMQFLKKYARLGFSSVTLDIPLLFETNAQSRLDAVACLMASENIRVQRVMRRPYVKFETLQGVLERQVDDRTRKLNSDFLLQSGLSRASLMPQLKRVLSDLPKRAGSKKWTPGWGREKLK
jgi:dephospho-CoA kinase